MLYARCELVITAIRHHFRVLYLFISCVALACLLLGTWLTVGDSL